MASLIRWYSFFIGLCLSLACVLLYVRGLGNLPFYKNGELREAAVVWEIWHSGDWILPLRNGQIIPSKPPLFHWLGALLSHAWGEVNELTIRLPSVLLGSLGVLLTYGVGVALWGVEAGVIAAVILGTSPEWIRAATIARVDMTLAVCMVAALLWFFLLYRHRSVSRTESSLFFILLGLAALAKGPVGVLLPGMIIGVFLLVRHDVQFLRQMHLLCGAALLIGIVTSWYGLALWYGGQEFWNKVMAENVIRFLSGVAHKHRFYFFIPALFLGMAPWSFFFPSLVTFLYQRRRTWTMDGFLYLIVWITTVFLFYSASSGKRSIYILPLYPAVALLLGAWWAELIHTATACPKDSFRLVRKSGYLILLTLGLIAGILLAQLLGYDVLWLVWPFFHHKDDGGLPLLTHIAAANRTALLVWLGVGSVSMLVIVQSIWRHRWRELWGALVVVSLMTSFIVQDVFLPAITAARTLRPFLVRVVEQVGSAPLFFYRAFNNGALYYAGRRIPNYAPSLLQLGHPYFFLTWEGEWSQLADQNAGDMQVLEVSEVTVPEVGKRLVLISVPTGMPILTESAASVGPDQSAHSQKREFGPSTDPDLRLALPWAE